MKKYISIGWMCVLLMLITAACSDSSDEPAKPVENAKITISTSTELQQGSNPGEQVLTFSTNHAWTASSNQSWCKLDQTQGGPGNISLTLTTEANETYDNRTAVVTIKAGTVSQSVKLMQMQKDAIVVANKEYVLKSTDSELALEIQTNVGEDIKVETNVDWIQQVEGKSRGLEKKMLTFKIAANTEGKEREGVIKLTHGSIEQVIRVVQPAAEALVVAKTEYNVGAEASELAFEVQASQEVKVTTNAKWLKQITDKSREMKTYALKFAVAANEDVDAREGVIVVEAGGQKQEIKVIQAQKDAIVLAKNEFTVKSAASALNFDVQANVDFAVEVDVDWIKQVKEKSRGLQAYPVNFEIAENTTYDQRVGTITFSKGDVKQTVRVVQMQHDAIVVSKKEYVLRSTDKELAFEVQANVDFTVKTDVAWIQQITEKSRGLETKKLRFKIDRNSEEKERAGKIILQSGDIVQEISVIQPVKDAIVVAKTEYTVGAEAGVLAFDVQANAEIKVKTNVEWLKQVTAGGREMTTYALKFNYTANEKTESRQGIITIEAGDSRQEIVVNQAQQDAIVLAKNEYVVESAASVLNFEVQANVDFNVEVEGNWIKQVKQQARGMKAYPLSFEIAANDTYEQREGWIHISKDGLKQSVKVVQTQNDALLVAKNEYEVKGEASELNLEIQTNLKFKVETNVEWLTQVTEKTRALQRYPLKFKVAENTTKEKREGLITVTAGSLKQVVKVVQLVAEGGSEPVLKPQVAITHTLKLFEVPTFAGTDVLATILWGDKQQEAYKPGATHTYTTEGSHTVIIEVENTEEMMLKTLNGVTGIDFSKF